jgi:hypothetical protein
MTSEKRYYRLGAIILLAGLLAATAVYLRTTPADDDGVQDGNSSMVRPDDSKRYERQMEQISGKTGVLAAQSMDWFESLWQGRNLAYTLAVLSVGGSLACLFLANFQILGPPSDPTDPKDV